MHQLLNTTTLLNRLFLFVFDSDQLVIIPMGIYNYLELSYLLRKLFNLIWAFFLYASLYDFCFWFRIFAIFVFLHILFLVQGFPHICFFSCSPFCWGFSAYLLFVSCCLFSWGFSWYFFFSYFFFYLRIFLIFLFYIYFFLVPDFSGISFFDTVFLTLDFYNIYL